MIKLHMDAGRDTKVMPSRAKQDFTWQLLTLALTPTLFPHPMTRKPTGPALVFQFRVPKEIWCVEEWLQFL